MRRAARNLAISSKKSLCTPKKWDRREAEGIYGQAASHGGFHVGHALGDGEGQLLHGVGTGFAGVITADGDGVPVGNVLGAELHHVGGELESRAGRQRKGLLPVKLLERIVLDGAAQGGPGCAAGFGNMEEHTKQHDGGVVDGQRDAGLVQGDAVEELAHVSGGVDCDPQASHFALGQLVVRIVSGESRVIKVGAEPGLAVGQQEPITFIGGSGSPKTGIWRRVHNRPRYISG